MCSVSTKYQNLIDQLVKNTYPAIHESLNCLSADESALHSLQLKRLIKDFQKEFRSLESFEKKLIFPSILSVFNGDDSRKTSVFDIDAIINITTAREERLLLSMNEIIQILQSKSLNNPDFDTAGKIDELKRLSNIFYTDFLSCKKLWKENLMQLQNVSTICNNKVNDQCECSTRLINGTYFEQL